MRIQYQRLNKYLRGLEVFDLGLDIVIGKAPTCFRNPRPNRLGQIRWQRVVKGLCFNSCKSISLFSISSLYSSWYQTWSNFILVHTVHTRLTALYKIIFLMRTLVAHITIDTLASGLRPLKVKIRLWFHFSHNGCNTSQVNWYYNNESMNWLLYGGGLLPNK